jgi:SAM-dependent MidA family methyltransferase
MLRDLLVDRIARDGPMPFETFMAACLYEPGSGFFARGPLRSTAGGDFLTSPEVSSWFGRTLARFVAGQAQRLGAASLDLVEVGAGSGSLLTALLTAPECPSLGQVLAVDASPASRDALGAVAGVDEVMASLDDVGGPLTGVVVANELLDNLPAGLVVRTGDGWEERWVGADDGELTLVAAPVRPEMAAWADAYAGTVPEGGMVEVQLAAMEWVRHAVGVLAAGALVAFDYGGTMEELEPRRTLGTLRTYRAHHLGPDPLAEPGETDVTVDVNFTAMVAAAEAAGASVTLLRQDDFLEAWGLRDELRMLRHEEQALARDGDPMQRLRVRAEITDADTLLHPRGLGDFRVLVAEVG